MKTIHTSLSKEQIRTKLEVGVANRSYFGSLFNPGKNKDSGYYGVVQENKFYLYYKKANVSTVLSVMLSGKLEETMDGCDITYTCHKNRMLLSGFIVYVLFDFLLGAVIGFQDELFINFSFALLAVSLADCLLFVINPKSSVKRMEDELHRLVD